MRNGKLFRIAVLLLMVAMLGGCEQTAEKCEEMTLHVYLDAYTKEYMLGLIEQFVRENPQIDVITEDYSALNIPDFRTKLAGDLMAGEGPDVILAANQTNNTAQSFTKLIQNGAVLNLNTLSPDLSACAPAVLKAGQYNGQQYLIPLNYSLGFLLTTEQRLKEHGISCEGDLQAFAASLADLYEAEKYAFLDVFTIEFLYRQNGLNLIDYDEKQLSSSEKDIETMRKLSKTYGDLFPRIFEGNTMMQYQFTNKLKNYKGSVEEAFLSGDLVFFSAPAFMGAYENLTYMNSVCQKILEKGETPVLLQMPTVDGQMASPCVNYYLFVNGNTSNTAAAKLFIESAVGAASQYAVSAQAGIPVNTEIVGAMRSFYTEGVKHETYDFVNRCAFPPQITDTYFSCIDGMSDGVYIDVMSCGRLFSIIRTYLTDGGSIENAYTIGKQQLEMYLAE